jgi:hypothetical protein
MGAKITVSLPRGLIGVRLSQRKSRSAPKWQRDLFAPSRSSRLRVEIKYSLFTRRREGAKKEASPWVKPWVKPGATMGGYFSAYGWSPAPFRGGITLRANLGAI